MSLIQKAAFFEMCTCKLHGRIILSNGEIFSEVVTKPQGLYIISQLFKEKRISSEEADMMRTALAASGLSNQEEDFDTQMELVLRQHPEISDTMMVIDGVPVTMSNIKPGDRFAIN